MWTWCASSAGWPPRMAVVARRRGRAAGLKLVALEVPVRTGRRAGCRGGWPCSSAVAETCRGQRTTRRWRPRRGALASWARRAHRLNLTPRSSLPTRRRPSTIAASAPLMNSDRREVQFADPRAVAPGGPAVAQGISRPALTATITRRLSAVASLAERARCRRQRP